MSQTIYLETNYYGTKKLFYAFKAFNQHGGDFNQGARIVNITSNLAHVQSAMGNKELLEAKRNTRERFDQVQNTRELDGLILEFQHAVECGRVQEDKWPRCAYTISKMATNAFTRYYEFHKVNWKFYMQFTALVEVHSERKKMYIVAKLR